MKHYKIILLSFLALSFGSCGKDDALEGNTTLQNGHTNWGHRDSVTVNCRIIRIKRRMLHTPLTKMRDV